MNTSQRELAIICADYQDYKGLEDAYEFFSEDIRYEFNRRYSRYCTAKSIPYSKDRFTLNNLIILWKNTSDNAKGKVDFKKAFDIICNGKDGFGGTLYVDSLIDLISVYGFEQTVRYLCLLNRAGRKVVFFDNDYFSSGLDKATDNTSAEQMMSLAIQAISSNNTLDKLEEILPDEVGEPIDGFVEYYWDWQRLKEPIENCKTKIGIYHRTLYKYSQLYEETLYYQEHLKLFPDIKDFPKRGTLPDKDDFMQSKASMLNGLISQNDFMQKYGLHSEIDILRTESALEKRKRMSK